MKTTQLIGKPDSILNVNIKGAEILLCHHIKDFVFVVFLTTPFPFCLSGIMSDHQFGNQFMCSVVASHVSHLPQPTSASSGLLHLWYRLCEFHVSTQIV